MAIRPLTHAALLLSATLMAPALLAQGAAAQSSQPVAPPPPAPPVTYTCSDGTSIVARFPDTNTALIVVGNDRYELKTTMAASGVRYAGAGLVFWTHQGDASFERGGKSLECKGPRG